MSAWEFREPKVGEWVIVASPEEGDQAVLRVERVMWLSTSDGGAEVFAMSDGSAWAVETALPLSRRWKGHNARFADQGTLCNRSAEVFARLAEKARTGELPTMMLAQLYGALLALGKAKS